MIRSQIIGPWINADDGTGELMNQPEIQIDYPIDTIDEMNMNVTDQVDAQLIPDPNSCVFEIVRTDDKMALIRADTKYQILWEETA